MKYILGSGGFALELVEWIRRDGTLGEIAGFVVDDARAVSGGTSLGLPVIGFSEANAGAGFYMGVSDPELKRKFQSSALTHGLVPCAYVSSSAIVAASAEVGVGTVICPFSTVSPLAVVGSFVTINCRSGVGHHVRIGDYCSLLGSTSVNGNASIGACCVLGAGSLIRPGVNVGESATVGMGAVVMRDVASRSTVFGNPAKRVEY